jgi:glucose-6-phosphate isomerase
MKFDLGEYTHQIAEKIGDLNAERIIDRIWEKDFTVWGDHPGEIANRLGWLDSIGATRKSLNEIIEFVAAVKKDKLENVLLMGMGGSSLAPEVFSKVFKSKKGFLKLFVLDSTDPGVILDFTKNLNPQKTLYIVSTKSGGTVETISFMKFFYNNALKKVGKEKISKHFAAITDPGSGLEQMAKDLNFRKIFLNDPDIGGRYSSLSLFGMVPAALIGIDILKILDRAYEIAEQSKLSGADISKNESALLGVIMGMMADASKDKITFICSEKISSIGAWIEQLIAESTGKNSRGILPVDLEPAQPISNYSKDRLFVFVKLKNDSDLNPKFNSFKKSGFPVITIELKDVYDLGKEFFRWEFATAVAGWAIGIQPFDQPNVEQAKVIARKMVSEYQSTGKLPVLRTSLEKSGVKVYGESKGKNSNEILKNFFNESESGKSYVAIHAYLKPDTKTWSALQSFRKKILKKFKVATTLGYGPRFLHSTGQLHKGDSGNGLFIQFLGEIPTDAPIPDEAGSENSSITFGILKTAQALGDRQALIDNNRKVLTIDLGKKIVETLKKMSV